MNINKKILSGGLSVSDYEVKNTIIKLAEELKIIVEPGGAVATAALLNNKLDEAEDCYRKAISIDKNYNAAVEGLGNTLLKKGIYEEALVNLRKANGSIFFSVKDGMSIKSEV